MALLHGILIILIAVWTTVRSQEAQKSEYLPGYGTEWLYFISDNEATQIMNFSNLPTDTRSMFFGDAYFHLYTRRNTEPEELTIPESNSSIASTYFDPTRDIKVITHGWLSNHETEWLQNIKNAYLRKYDYNVISVDWGELARNPTYVWSALSTRYVGNRLAKLLNALVQSYQVQGRNMHLIGHSLGAQVMGYAGMFSEEKIHRITGLDPARPLFEVPYMAPDFRLEKSDAEFVDIIHTCGGVLGYRCSHGHADFYPNGGHAPQPGCSGARQMSDGCSHGKSCLFFEESIESDRGFTAFPCTSWQSFENGECKTNCVKMGDPAPADSRGDYYLHTSE